MDIYKFTSNGKTYVYDSNINQLARVDKAVYNLLPMLPDEIQKKKLSEQEINAIKEIRKYQEQYSMFLPRKKQKIQISFEDVKMDLDNNLSHIILNITDKCNLRCKYCIFGEHYTVNDGTLVNTMSWETARKSVDFLLDHSQNRERLVIGFYGGEPLLKLNLIRKVINYSKNKIKEIGKKVNFAVTTNGTLLTNEACRFLVDEDFSLLVSIDGPKYIHDRYIVDAKQQGTWEKIVEGLKELKQMDPDYYDARVGFSVVLAPPFKLNEVYNFFRNFELRTHGPTFVSIASDRDTTFYDSFSTEIWRVYNDQKKLLQSTLIDVISKGDEPDEFLKSFFLKNIYLQWHSRYIGETSDLQANGICIPGQHRTFVAPKGDIFPCEKLAYRMPIGNVFTGFDLKQIKYLLDKYINLCDNCYTCWLRRSCQICFAKVITSEDHSKYDISEERKNLECRSMQEESKRSIALYAQILETNPDIFDSYNVAT